MTSLSDISDLKEQSFPFENIVLEGGGSKAAAYIGVMQVLEETGVVNNIKRFAGASVGSVFATLMALGFTSKEVRILTSKMTMNTFLDASWGYLSLLPNLLLKYGWHSGNLFKQHMTDSIVEKFGKPEITFGELYYEHGRELCIVAANISIADVAYFHPKTTPDMSIVEAVTMSIALPFVMQPKMSHINGREEFFVDGGILNNFPINVFDGWYLNMEPKNSFLYRDNIEEEQSDWFDPLTPSIKEKTLGVILFAEHDREVFKKEFIARLKPYPVIRPDTDMMKKGMDLRNKLRDSYEKQRKLKEIVHRLTARLGETHIGMAGSYITKEQMIAALEDMNMTENDFKAMFSEPIPNKISINHLTTYFSSEGVPLHHGVSGNSSREITGFLSFLNAVTESVMARVKGVAVKGDDIRRIVGVDTDYVTVIADPTEDDYDFMIRQGRNATIAFLKEFADKREKGTLLWNG